MIFAMADPQLPEPMIATFSLLAPPRSESSEVAPAVASSAEASSECATLGLKTH